MKLIRMPVGRTHTTLYQRKIAAGIRRATAAQY